MARMGAETLRPTHPRGFRRTATALLLAASSSAVGWRASASADEPDPDLAGLAARIERGEPTPGDEREAPDAPRRARLRAVADDERSPRPRRVAALALLAATTPEATRQALRSLFAAVEGRPAGIGQQKRPSWEERFRRVLRQDAPPIPGEAVAWLTDRALLHHERNALAALGWVPGPEALLVVLAAAPADALRPARALALVEQVTRFPEAAAAVLAEVRRLPAAAPDRCRLLEALVRQSAVPMRDAALGTLSALAAAERAPWADEMALLRSLASLPALECGEALSALVVRWPDLLEPLRDTLRAHRAPVPKSLLWDRLGRGDRQQDERIVSLLAGRLAADDEEALLAALAPERWKEGGFWHRLKMLESAPTALRTDAVHAALWRIVEDPAAPPVLAGFVVPAIAAFADAADTPRLERVAAAGSPWGAFEAFREVLRRRPAARHAVLLAWLDADEPARREVAVSVVQVDGAWGPSGPIAGTPDEWRRVARVLSRRALAEEDAKRRGRILGAYMVATGVGPLSPMQVRTADDEDGLADFAASLVEKDPTPEGKRSAVHVLSSAKTQKCLAFLERMAADPDPRVAEAAAMSLRDARAAPR